MKNNSVISLKEITEGKLLIEMRSSDEYIVMNLHNKSCEPIAEMGDILLDIYNHCKSMKHDESHSFYLFWECDTVQHTLEFSLNSDYSIGLNISYCPDIFAGIRTESELQLYIKTSIQELMENFFEEMKKILLEYGFIGYKKRWLKRDFPISTFLRLYSILHGNRLEPASLPRCLKCLQEMTGDDSDLIFNDK